MEMQGKTKMVAIVDDDDSMRSALQGLLKAVGLPAQAFASGEEFLKSGQRQHTACFIADIPMPGMNRRGAAVGRSGKHTAEIPSLTNILFRLLLLKKKKHEKLTNSPP